MMESVNWLQRTELLLGNEGIDNLKKKHVLVVGLGGVGAYAAEMICRAGVGKMTIIDGDVVETSNRNRQLPALISNEGKPKAEIMASRFFDINPALDLKVMHEFVRDDRTKEILEMDNYDYVVDAIDTLAPKVFLIHHCVERKIPVVSSMGAGGKFNPGLIQVADLSKTYNCKLARMLRKRLSKLGIKKGVKTVFSSEEIEIEKVVLEESQNKKSVVGTISYMPAVFGCFCASVVIRDLIELN